MTKEQFVDVMRVLYRALYEVDSPTDKEQLEILMDMISFYIMLLAGFDPILADNINTYVFGHPDFNEEEVVALYDFYIAPDGEAN